MWDGSPFGLGAQARALLDTEVRAPAPVAKPTGDVEPEVADANRIAAAAD